jgi:catalase
MRNRPERSDPGFSGNGKLANMGLQFASSRLVWLLIDLENPTGGILMPLPTDERLLGLSQKILGQFDGIFGVHGGFRPAHAKGELVTGTFTPSPDAASLTFAPHIQRPSTPVTVRFSNSTGVPGIPDNDPHADPRGMAIRFFMAEHSHTDIVSHSADGFPARTGDEFSQLLTALATSDMTTPPDPKNPKPIEKFLGTHPAALAFIQAPKPPPASFARLTYFAVTAYKFTNGRGASRFGRYRIVPSAGNDALSPEAFKTKGPNYLFDELKERISRGPIEFRVMVQLANDGDKTDDATVRWPADRTVMEFGKIVLTKLAPNDAAEQKQIIFDPIPRVTGIDPAGDPLLDVRAAVYLMSGKRRRAAN